MSSYAVDSSGKWAKIVAAFLPNSGVTAGTYGDSTHVGQFTVDAHGIVTAAASVGIAGAGSAGLTNLFDSTLGVAAATIDTGAGGVAAGFSDLIIRALARTTQAVEASSMLLTFNNDTGANYEIIRLTTDGSTVSTGNAGGQSAITLTALGASAAANLAATATCFVPAYTQTTFYKIVETMGGWLDFGVQGAVDVREYNWKNTAAITRIALTAGSGNLVAGSRLTVWGMP